MKNFIKVFLLLSLALIIAACSSESTPYEEVNSSISKQDQGYIQTH